MSVGVKKLLEGDCFWTNLFAMTKIRAGMLFRV